MRKPWFRFTSFLCLVSLASAANVTYDVAANTSSISGTMGSLDFNFNPGPLVTQSASLEILNFISDGSLAGGAVLTGDISGTLSAPLNLDNGTGFNDYFEGFTFGSNLSFEVTLSGAALDSPDGTSTSGSTFAFSMFSDAAGTVPVLTTDTTNGFALTVNVNLDGTTTLTDSSIQTDITELGGTTVVPEPSSSSLALLCLVLWVALVLCKKYRHKQLSRVISPELQWRRQNVLSLATSSREREAGLCTYISRP